MPLTDTQLADVRAWIGDSEPPTDFDLDDIYDRLAVPTVAGVAHQVLTKRLAEYLAEPASYTIEGVYQESSQANITGLLSLLNDLLLEKTTQEEEVDPLASGKILRVRRIVRNGRAR